MTTNDLAYPVIEIDRDGNLGVNIDEDTLTTTTSHILKKGFNKGMTIVDSNGKAIKVKEAKFVSGKGRFWGYYSPFLDRIIKIELIFDGEPFDMPFEEVKKKVLSDVRKWGHSMDPDYARGEVRRIGEARNFRELIERFRSQGDNKELYETLKKF
jgi:hypothetical protein